MEVIKGESSPGMLERAGYLFYIVNPKTSAFALPEQVPNYIIEVLPWFTCLIVLEFCIGRYKNRKHFSLNDGIGSMSQGIIEQLTHFMGKSSRYLAYAYIYNNWRILTLPWDSVWTWVLCLFAIDFFYYWVHRAGHEINILWAAHQVHHSSEYYNLSTALRQPMFLDLGLAILYVPMALCLPTSLYLVHIQLNLIYQFWIHTHIIGSLGPLEYILNTPSHHRVHHGRNRYCIDKNFGGTLIIWDRIFGTFEAESQEVVYGLTHPINSFSPFYIQLAHYSHILKTFWHADGIKHKLSAIFKGPGWEPGKPWHGLIEDIPDIQAPVDAYNPKITSWRTAYVLGHFTLVLLAFIEFAELCGTFSQALFLGVIAYILLSLTTIGALLDGRLYAPWLELVRCILFILVDFYFLPATRLVKLSNTTVLVCLTLLLRVCFICSTFLWLLYCIKSNSVRFYTKAKENRE